MFHEYFVTCCSYASCTPCFAERKNKATDYPGKIFPTRKHLTFPAKKHPTFPAKMAADVSSQADILNIRMSIQNHPQGGHYFSVCNRSYLNNKLLEINS